MDEETGLYHYGARYYDARVSVFLSVDLLSEKYIYQSPYAYATNNPIKYTDVLGLGPGDGVDPESTPRIRPKSVSLNKRRFQMENRIDKDGSIRIHYGVDILASKGTSLKSILAGEVISIRNSFKPGEGAENSYGNFIIIKSVVNGENVFLKYAHRMRLKLKLVR